jgi:hypothetical protein
VCLQLGPYMIETVQISDNFIKTARVRKEVLEPAAED